MIRVAETVTAVAQHRGAVGVGRQHGHEVVVDAEARRNFPAHGGESVVARHAGIGIDDDRPVFPVVERRRPAVKRFGGAAVAPPGEEAVAEKFNVCLCGIDIIDPILQPDFQEYVSMLLQSLCNYFKRAVNKIK